MNAACHDECRFKCLVVDSLPLGFSFIINELYRISSFLFQKRKNKEKIKNFTYKFAWNMSLDCYEIMKKSPYYSKGPVSKSVPYSAKERKKKLGR